MHVVCMHAPFSIVASCKNILMQGLKVLFPRIVYKAQIPLYIIAQNRHVYSQPQFWGTGAFWGQNMTLFVVTDYVTLHIVL